MNGLIVDLFAGGGGASLGIEAALGRPIDIAINHDAIALAVHKSNHPATTHLEADIWEVRPRDATQGRPVDLLWASPDCFPAGTVVLTEHGHRPIEEIRVGDCVLTHRLRWRRVQDVFKTQKRLLEIRGHGHPGLRVSEEHPFLTRRWKRKWNNVRRTYGGALEPQQWTPAGELSRGSYWASPLSFPKMPIPDVGGRGMPIDVRLLWLAGRYVGDGWSRLTKARAELVIICGKHEASMLRSMLNSWQRQGLRALGGELAWHEREVRTAVQFSTNHRGLVSWLREQFGHGAAKKRIPAWALGMESDLRKALLEGYLSADGHRARGIVDVTTVSRALAFGTKSLAESLGKTVAVYHGKTSTEAVIEDRTVKTRPVLRLRWREALNVEHEQTIVDGSFRWSPVREVAQPVDESPVLVFNLSVEEDESYTADGVIVHNCTHFSVAKGQKPRKQNIRSLAWAVTRWAKEVRPRIIMLENVQEFRGWGPLGPGGQPDKSRMGETFRRWLARLENLGYAVEYRVLDASLYGAPTRRRRLFLIARCDGQPIQWPEPTHGPGRLPVHTAAECIDFSIPCPSIFERKRPLAQKTLWRIAQGIKRFVIESQKPFIVRMSHGEVARDGSRRRGLGAHSADQPLPTITSSGGGGGFAVAVPLIAGVGGRAGQSHATGADAPTGTITAKNDRALIAPHLVKVNHGKIEDRSESLGAALSTVTASQRGQALVVPSLIEMNHSNAPHGLDESLGVVTTQHNRFQLVAPTLVQTGYGEREGQAPRALDIEEPLGTVVAGGQKHALVSAFLAKHFGGVVGHELDRPPGAITSVDHHALAAATLVRFNHDDHGVPLDEPLPTATAHGNHLAEVRAFLTAYYGEDKTGGQAVIEPMRTLTARHRMGLVTVEGTDYQIVDIGMRMLEPHELLAAQFGKFAASYDMSGAKTKAGKVRLIGNSVCPEIARALVAAVFAETAEAAA